MNKKIGCSFITSLFLILYAMVSFAGTYVYQDDKGQKVTFPPKNEKPLSKPSKEKQSKLKRLPPAGIPLKVDHKPRLDKEKK